MKPNPDQSEKINADPSLRSHLLTLSQHNTLNRKTDYALACIYQAIAPNNSKKNDNLILVSQQRKTFITLLTSAKACTQHQLFNLIHVINVLGPEILLQSSAETIKLEMTEITAGMGEMTSDICEEIRIFCQKFRVNTQVLLKSMIGKMSSQQMHSLLASLPKQDLYQTPLLKLIELAECYSADQAILKIILETIHWQTGNQLSKQQGTIDSAKNIAEFVSKIAVANLSQIEIMNLCSLIFRQLPSKGEGLLTNRQHQILLRQWTQVPMGRPYLPNRKKMIADFKDIQSIIESPQDISINIDFQTILNYYAHGRFPWRQQLESHPTQKILEKQLLLRATERFDKINQNTQRKHFISEKQEITFAEWLPVATIRTVQGLIKKVEISGPQEAVEAISILGKMNRSHPRFGELLIILVEKAVEHREFELLKQLERIVQTEIDSTTVVARLKEKGSVHKIDSNRQSKRYFALVPLLLSKTQTQLEVSDEIATIFGFQTVSFKLKLFVADFLLKKMIEKPLQKFIAVLLRTLQSSEGKSALKSISFYLKGMQNMNKATLDWISEHFQESGQRLLELIFSMLLGPAAEEAADVLFKLQKFGVYGKTWLPVYKWIGLALEEPTNQIITLDYLELFEMLLEKIGQGCLPATVPDRFERTISKNWGRYNHEHYFAIQRIIDLLNQSTMLSFKKYPLPSLSDLFRDQQQFVSTGRKKKQVDPISQFLRSLSWNLVFQHVDSSTAVKAILSIFRNNKPTQQKDEHEEEQMVSALQILLYVYEDAQSIVESDVDQFVFSLIEKSFNQQDSTALWKVWSLCLQYLSRVPHSINILKLPLGVLLKKGFNEKSWISSITDLLQIVIESKPKLIGGFKLQDILKSILIRMITLEKEPLEQYIDILDVACSIEGDYQTFLGQNLKLLERALVAEQHSGYRSSLVQYLLQTLQDYEYELKPETVWCLFNKYASDCEIVKLLLEYLEQKGWEFFDQQMLMRLVLTHTQQQEIQQKCKTLFNTHTPASNVEKQFMAQIGSGNFIKCEELIPSIVNPFSLTFSLPEVRGLLEWKQASFSTKKLVRFLYDHPDAHLKMHSCEALFLDKGYAPLLNETLALLKTQPSFEKFNCTPNKSFCSLKTTPISKTIYSTLVSMIKNKALYSQFKGYLIDVFKNNQDIAGGLAQLMTLTLEKGCQGEGLLNIMNIYKFCREIVGEWELISSEKVNRYNLKQLIYIFPYTLSELNSERLPLAGLLTHYYSLLQLYKVIKNEIGIQRYIEKIRKAILERYKGEEKEKLIEGYLKLHIPLENKNQLMFEDPKQNSSKQNHQEFITKMMENSNYFLQSKMTDPSTKLELNQVSGYITTLLHSVSLGFSIDPPTSQRLQLLEQNIDNYNFQQDSRSVLKEALNWLLKKTGKSSLPQTQSKKSEETTKGKQLKLQAQFSQPGQQKYSEPISPSKYKNQTQKEDIKSFSKKNEETSGPLSLYASMRHSDLEDKDEGQLKKQVDQSYIRYKQTEERITINEQEKETITTVILLDQQSPIDSKILEPLDLTINEQKLYNEVRVQTHSELERQSNLQFAKKIKGGQFSIQSLKDHCKFISFLADLPTISPEQFSQLLISLQVITETVQSHTFYVKKVVDNQSVFKLIRIYKNFSKGNQKKQSASVAVGTLKLCEAMAEKKEKKLQLFGDDQTINFFKLLVKKVLNGERGGEEIPLLLSALFACRNNTEVYFRTGLFSMVVQLVNRDIFADQVIDYLIRIDLSSQLINEVYQRGLFNKLISVVSKQSKGPQERTVLNLWVRLAGKVCINKAIQQRFVNKQLHIKVWQQFKTTTTTPQLLNLCYFYAFLCIKNDTICQWLMKHRALEVLLSALKGIPLNQQLYHLFYHFCFSNPASKDYCFRLKYHLHLLQRLSQTKEDSPHLSKFFYKSLGQMMSSRLHVPVFFKEETVSKLVDLYNIKSEPAIYQCLLDFISILQTQAQFDQLKKQRFWDSLKLFQYKVSNQATYSYLLQTFLVMIKKGRTKQFNQAEVRSKVCLKAEYSINMDGKQLALRFILALSIKNKQNYLTERSIKLLASIMGLKVSLNQLQLAADMLKIEGTLKINQFLGYFTTHNIDNLIIENLSALTPEATSLALTILSNICLNQTSNKSMCPKMLPFTCKSIESSNQPQLARESLKLLSLFATNRQNSKTLSQIRISDILKLNTVVSSVKNNQLEKEYNQLLGNLITNGVLQDKELQQIIKTADNYGVIVNKLTFNSQIGQQENQRAVIEKAKISLKEGRKVRMYKTDGSVSQLLLFLSSDCLELNCGLKMAEVVKQKWRLPINEVTKVITYEGQQTNDFKSSQFEKNSGFFSSAPNYDCCLTLEGRSNIFNICFVSKEERIPWMNDFQVVRQHVKVLLSKLK